MRLETYSLLSAHHNAIVANDTAQYLSGGLSGTAAGFTDIPIRAVSLYASSTNASAIGIGPAATASPIKMSSAYPLPAGQAITIDIDNLNRIQVVGSQNDIIAWLGVK